MVRYSMLMYAIYSVQGVTEKTYSELDFIWERLVDPNESHTTDGRSLLGAGPTPRAAPPCAALLATRCAHHATCIRVPAATWIFSRLKGASGPTSLFQMVISRNERMMGKNFKVWTILGSAEAAGPLPDRPR